MTEQNFKTVADPYERPDCEPEGKGIAYVILIMLLLSAGLIVYLLFKLFTS